METFQAGLSWITILKKRENFRNAFDNFDSFLCCGPHQFEEIKICIGYDLDGKKIDYLPASSEQQFKVKPIYKTFKGWNSSTFGIKKFSDLPKNAQSYVNFIFLMRVLVV